MYVVTCGVFHHHNYKLLRKVRELRALTSKSCLQYDSVHIIKGQLISKCLLIRVFFWFDIFLEAKGQLIMDLKNESNQKKNANYYTRW